jgi:hypothetical protein
MRPARLFGNTAAIDRGHVGDAVAPITSATALVFLGSHRHVRCAFGSRAERTFVVSALTVDRQLHPVVPPHVLHFKHVPFRTSVKFPHSPQASPSYPWAFASARFSAA